MLTLIFRIISEKICRCYVFRRRRIENQRINLETFIGNHKHGKRILQKKKKIGRYICNSILGFRKRLSPFFRKRVKQKDAHHVDKRRTLAQRFAAKVRENKDCTSSGFFQRLCSTKILKQSVENI